MRRGGGRRAQRGCAERRAAGCGGRAGGSPGKGDAEPRGAVPAAARGPRDARGAGCGAGCGAQRGSSAGLPEPCSPPLPPFHAGAGCRGRAEPSRGEEGCRGGGVGAAPRARGEGAGLGLRACVCVSAGGGMLAASQAGRNACITFCLIQPVLLARVSASFAFPRLMLLPCREQHNAACCFIYPRQE